MKQTQTKTEITSLEYFKSLLDRKGCKVISTKKNDKSMYLEVQSPDGGNCSKIVVNTISDDLENGNVGVVASRNINGRRLPAGPFISPVQYFAFVVAGYPGAHCIETAKLKQLITEKQYLKMVPNENGEYNIAVFGKQLLLDNCDYISDSRD
jgi:hypothetical protein